MYISTFQIFNYKSFRDSGLLEFQPGINIIVGANNSGKTALLEALSLNFENNPYRNIRLRDIPNSEFSDKSTANLTFRLEKSEILALNGGKDYTDNQSKFYTFIHRYYINNENDLTIFQEWFDKTKKVEVTTSIYPLNDNCQPRPVISCFPTELEVSKVDFARFLLDEFFGKLKDKIYRFNAERFHIGSCPLGDSLILKPDSSNLAEVIYQIQVPYRRKVYERFKKYVNIIFPEIKGVFAILQNQENQDYLEVLVWSPEAYEEDDLNLALKLADCGTGVSQVLAILYVVITASEPKFIIIDEPQSFLHPNLIRKLINIFKEFPQHQYFIATHSPTVISEANPATILQLSYSDGETKTKIIDSKETIQLRSLLKELGVSLSDVFGADAILWVEGPTEEMCFPLILDKFAPHIIRGMQIMAVKNTGDLSGKRAQIIFDIYDKLSGGNSLLPPAIGFILDDENRSEKDKQDIRKRGKVEFLERCTYENYLLHPQAIFEILKQEDSSLEIALTDINNYLDQAKDERRLLPKNYDVQDNWISKVDGAKLISEIFSKYSDNRVEYKKTKHSLDITNWLLEYEPQFLEPLAKFLKETIEQWINNYEYDEYDE